MFDNGLSVGCCFAIYIAIIVTAMSLFGVSYSTVEVGTFAILQNKFSKKFDTEIYYSGRYQVGLAKKFIGYPLVYQALVFSQTKQGADSGPITSTTSSGSSISVGCLVQYVIRPEKIFDIYLKWPDPERLKSDLKASIKQIVSSIINQYRPEDFRTKRAEINTRMSYLIGQAMKTNFFVDLNIFTISQVILEATDLNAFLQAQLTNKATLLQQQTNLVSQVESQITAVNATAAANVSTISSATASQAAAIRLNLTGEADNNYTTAITASTTALKAAFNTSAGGLTDGKDFSNFMYFMNIINDRTAGNTKFMFD